MYSPHVHLSTSSSSVVQFQAFKSSSSGTKSTNFLVWEKWLENRDPLTQEPGKEEHEFFKGGIIPHRIQMHHTLFKDIYIFIYLFKTFFMYYISYNNICIYYIRLFICVFTCLLIYVSIIYFVCLSICPFWNASYLLLINIDGILPVSAPVITINILKWFSLNYPYTDTEWVNEEG